MPCLHGSSPISLFLDRPTLPVLRTADVVVAGGSFGGIAAALAFARAGRRVVLVEPRTYLGREMTATLRPWVNLDGADRPPEIIAACIRAAGTVTGPGEVPLKLDAVKLCLEDLLLDAGVQLVYASLPVDVLVEDGSLSGLVIGNKSGRQVLGCRMVIDATETAAVARAAGAVFESALPEPRFGRTLEFDGVQPLEGPGLSVPEDLGLVENALTLHRGYRGEEHVYVECRMDLGGGIGLEASLQREVEARHRTMRLAAYLVSHVPAFQRASLAACSHELHGAHTSRMADPAPDGIPDASLAIPGEGDSSLSSFAGPVPGLWCLSEVARLEPAQAARLRDPVSASFIGTALVGGVLAHWDQVLSTQSPDRVSAARRPTGPALEVKEPESPQRGRRYEQRPVSPLPVDVLRSADVLVVGGGTSGATAAITAAREGMRTVLLDMNPELGGSGTIGGVNEGYWFGRRVGFVERVSGWVDEVQGSLNVRRGPQWVDDRLDYETGYGWNIEAKQYALLRAAQHVGVEMFFNVLALGAVVEGNGVRGVVAVTRWGVYAFLAQVVIDATGDGDVAAFAGAETVYGDARDHVTMWYSLAQLDRPGHARNNFTSMVDVGNVEDYTRAILAGRRRGGDLHEHGAYLAPRESRHVVGDEVVTLTDQVRRRQWPDVVNVHFSNHDVKGHTGSDWLRQGLIPPNLEIEIPYRALLPRGLEDILVVGKAISTTHDGLAALRMQSDLENLGGVVGLAAAQAVREAVGPRHIDVAALQQRLVDEGVLPQELLTRAIEQPSCTNAELEILVESLETERPLYTYCDMGMSEVFGARIPFVEVCTAGPRIVPVLEGALASAEGAWRVRIAQALAMLGSQAGVPTLIAEVERHLAAGSLPVRDHHVRYAQAPPDQGVMPVPAYLLYSLGMAKDRRSIAVWGRVAELLDPTEENLRDERAGTFYYIDSVCFGAERLGDPEAVPILERLHAHPTLRDQVSREGVQVDFFLERQAMLELVIGRALARCGSPRGVEILIAYLEDNRALLAEQAHTELVAISGEDQGKDPQAWADWLASRVGSLEPRPL